MKSRFLFGTLLMALFSSTFIMSCSKDDEKEETVNNSIYGAWQRESDKSDPNRFYYFSFSEDGTCTRVIVEYNAKDEIISKEVSNYTFNLTDSEITIKDLSYGKQTTFKYKVEGSLLTLSQTDSSTGEIIISNKWLRVSDLQFNKILNAKVVISLTIHKQWMTTDVQIVNPYYYPQYSAVVLDLTEADKGYMYVCAATSDGKHVKGHWYLSNSGSYTVHPTDDYSGSITYETGSNDIEYKYLMSENTLDLTLESKNLTAHYVGVKDIEPDSEL